MTTKTHTAAMFVAFLVAWIGASIGVSACSKKGPECAAFIDVINRDGEALKRASVPSAKGSSREMAVTMRATADAADKLAADVSKLTLTLPELQKISPEYQAMAKDAGGAARDLAGVLDEIAAADAAARANASDPAVRSLMDASDKAAKYCAAHAAPECTKVTGALKDVAGTADDPAKLDAFAATLASITTKNAQLAAIVVTLGKSVKDASVVMRSARATAAKMKGLRTEMQAAKTRLDAAIGREAELTTRINAMCSG